jgi:hypothetical protein
MSEADDFFTETIEANLDAFATIVLFQLRRTTGKLHFTTTYVDPKLSPMKSTLLAVSSSAYPRIKQGNLVYS